MVCMVMVGNMVGMLESIVVSFASSLVGFHPYMCLFSFFCDLFLLVFVLFFFRRRCIICNVQKYRTLLFTRTKYHHKFNCFQVESIDPNIKVLIYGV